MKRLASCLLLLFVLASVGWLLVKEGRRAGAADEAATPPAEARRDDGTAPTPAGTPARGATPQAPQTAPAPARQVVVTYFVTNTRCFSCYKIETLTESTVVNTFPGPLREGRLVWRTVNTDEPENAHYLKDYKLFTKSVVVSEVVDGKEVRWKNCGQVWDLLDDPEAFRAYIVREVRAYLGDA